ncbi:glycoside hydrolase [Mycena sp. CBHHK59/15]|nr:glycoside hydrolase [Mycena sp. CBHHK59/15]
MGCDEYHRISHRGSNLSSGRGIGYTVVDAVDTMLLMGLDTEYDRASRWIREELRFHRDGSFSTFEVRAPASVPSYLLTTPRRQQSASLAASSAFHLTSDARYLRLTRDLGTRPLPALVTPSGLVLPFVHLARGSATPQLLISTAEASTLQLDFRALAQLTGEGQYWWKAEQGHECDLGADPQRVCADRDEVHFSFFFRGRMDLMRVG